MLQNIYLGILKNIYTIFNNVIAIILYEMKQFFYLIIFISLTFISILLQSILSLLTSDLFTTLKACVSGDLPSVLPTFDVSQTAVGVVVVSGGYPGSYKKGLAISGKF